LNGAQTALVKESPQGQSLGRIALGFIGIAMLVEAEVAQAVGDKAIVLNMDGLGYVGVVADD
jgi:hypothetical protein